MGRNSIKLVVFILVGTAMAGIMLSRHSSSIEPTASASIPRPFVVFDATLYKDKPSLAPYQIRPITLLYESRLFVADQPPAAVPHEYIVRSLAYELRDSQEPVVLDIERWPLKGDEITVRSTVDKFLKVFSWFEKEAPRVAFGVYGTVPVPDYWRAIRDPASAEFQSWQQDNDRLERISDRVDALFPSIYTFYPDRQGWVTYAIAQIAEARRKAKGKPVYAFIWPQYHESNTLLSHQPLDPDYWELQLKTVAQHADGAVIWGGWGENGPEPWNEEAPWWQATKRFMSQLDQTAPAVPKGFSVQ
jgi:Hyaluronidase